MMEQMSENARLLALLKRLEWSPFECQGETNYCPECEAWHGWNNEIPHEPGCELKAAIDRLEKGRAWSNHHGMVIASFLLIEILSGIKERLIDSLRWSMKKRIGKA